MGSGFAFWSAALPMYASDVRVSTVACLFTFFSGTPLRLCCAAFEELTGRRTEGVCPLMNILRSFVAVTNVRIFAGDLMALTWRR